MSYIHGSYGELANSKAQNAAQAGSVAVYIGTAPVHQISGYAEKGLINTPVKIENLSDAKAKLGWSDDWEKYTLCEAIAAHFNNTVGNVGPIYVINVLDPSVHAGEKVVAEAVVMNNDSFSIPSVDVVRDSIVVSDHASAEFTIEYDSKMNVTVVKLKHDCDKKEAAVSYDLVDTSKVTAATIIGSTTEDGQYSGLDALKLLYQEHNAVINMLAAPGWSQIPEVYKAMVSAVQKLNGHWDGFVNADIPLVDAEGAAIDTIAKAIKWKADNGYTSERSKVYWPMVKDGSGKVYHLSTVGQATMLRVDLGHDSVPFESPSNKEIMATCQYFGKDSKNKGYDQVTCNGLNEKGITTACFWGGRWVLWGPHTAAYNYGGNMDARSIFDSNIRMLMHLTNGFQLRHGVRVDAPLTPQEKDTILNVERENLDTLCGIGALIGSPTVEFVESANPVSDMMNGDFVWDISGTPTPPLKSATGRVCYTDEGFAAFFGE